MSPVSVFLNSRNDYTLGNPGESKHSFGFGATAKFSTAWKFLDYGALTVSFQRTMSINPQKADTWKNYENKAYKT